MIRLFRKALARPEIEKDRVRVVVARHEFAIFAALQRLPCPIEQHGHGVAGDVPGRIVAAVLVAAPGVDEMREIELVDPLRYGEIDQIRQLMMIVLRHGEAQARLHAAPSTFAQARERRVECAFAAAKPVMRRAEPVEADADIVIADICDAPGEFGVDQRAVGGQGRIEAEIDRALRNVEYVRAQQRLAAGQDQDGRTRGLDVVHHAEDLGCRQLAGKIDIRGDGIAMLALQIAAPHEIPDDDGARQIAMRSDRRRRAQFAQELRQSEHDASSRARRARRMPVFLRISVENNMSDDRHAAPSSSTMRARFSSTSARVRP